jgi:alpha,alpha-trehalase
MLAITSFLPGDDPRMKATIDATAERLTDERGLVYRYLAHDGLEGEEGTFLLCTFWLAQAQALAGEVDQAKATFERAVAFTNDVGLLAEEIDPASGELIGNFPQAFSHIGLVNAAWAITQALVITMRDIEGFSSAEVCNALEISDTNQRVLLHRARTRVRRALEDYLT